MPTIVPDVSRTFGEYLLIPGLTTEESIPDNVNIATPLTKFKKGEEPAIKLNIPLVSAIMQSVSDDTMAIALAQEGGLAFIFGSQSIADEAAMVSRVKKYKAGFIVSDTNVTPDATMQDVYRITAQTGHATVAVTSDGSPTGTFAGLLTAIDYDRDGVTPESKVSELMTPAERIIAGKEGMSLSEANHLIRDKRVHTLPILTAEGRLVALVFRKDLHEHLQNPLEIYDSHKRLLVGAGINTRDYEERVPALVNAGADVLCIDSSDGFSVWQKKTIDFIRSKYGESVKVGAGNVVDKEGFDYLAEAGADFIKVGVGGGAICITREQKGIGRGQASALMEVCAARDEYFAKKGVYVPVCSDGGIVHDYHMIIAFAMGADFLMMGRYFARFDESPTHIVKIGSMSYKEYWGEGSNRARNWQRYEMGDKSTGKKEMSFEEGVDSYVPYAGKMKDSLRLTLAKLKSTMCNCGSLSLPDFYRKAKLTVVSELSVREGGAHDVMLKNDEITRKTF